MFFHLRHENIEENYCIQVKCNHRAMLVIIETQGFECKQMSCKSTYYQVKVLNNLYCILFGRYLKTEHSQGELVVASFTVFAVSLLERTGWYQRELTLCKNRYNIY